MRTRMIFVVILVAILSIAALVWFGVFSKLDRKLILTKAQKITVNNSERSYRVVDFSDSDTKKPLIIGLHGFQDRGLWHGLYSGLHLLSEREKVVVALPEGSHQSWNAEFCCGYAYENKINDTRFILEMIETLKNKYSIDEERIYVTGFSNGGAFAQRLIEEHPEVFSGAGSVMSGIGSNSEQLKLKKASGSIVLFQGENDQYVPLRAGSVVDSGFQFLSAETTKHAWTDHYQADLTRSNETGTYVEEIYSKNQQQKILYRLYKDTSHRWPQWRLWGLPDEVPDSTQTLWDFLKKNH